MIETGVNALDFVNKLIATGQTGWDTVIWDPPYMDPDDPKLVERLNSRSRYWTGREKYANFNSKPTLRFMPIKVRDKILKLIKESMDPNGYIVHFHTIQDKLPKKGCRHGWIKPAGILTGSSCPNNVEWIHFEGPKIPRNRQIMKYLPLNSEYKMVNGVPNLVRGCAKPEPLFHKIYRHCGSKYVLDPFAGYGRSISAARLLDIQIDACDIDPELDWNFPIPKVFNITSVEEYF